jgi:hypothetical protein
MYTKRLSAFAWDAAACGYEIPEGDLLRKLRDAASCARIPAQMRGPFWYFNPDDLHDIAEVLGMQQRAYATAA